MNKHGMTWGAVVVVFVAGMLASAHATGIAWDAAGGGSFGDGSHWEGGQIPAAGERALFGLEQEAAYTVTLDQERTLGSLQVLNDTLVLDLAGHKLTLTDSTGSASDSDAFDWEPALMVGRGVDGDTHHTADLTIQGGGELNVNNLLLGGTADSTGTLTVQGSNTLLYLTSSGAHFGYRGEGELIIRDGAEVSTRGMRMTRGSGGFGRIIVEGEGSTYTMRDSNMALGYRGEFEFIVRDGGHLAAADAVLVTVAERSVDGQLIVSNATAEVNHMRLGIHEATGTVEVRGGGSLQVNGYLNTSEGTTSSGGIGIVRVADADSILTVGGVASFGGTDAEDKEEDATLAVTAGATAEFADRLQLWSQARLEIDDGYVTAATLDAASGAVFALTLNAALANNGALITVSNNAAIAGAQLDLGLAEGYTPQLYDVFTLLQVDGDLTGTFSGLSDQAEFEIEDTGVLVRINYISNNDSVTLTVIPEPGSLLLLGLAAGGLLLAKRRPVARGCRTRALLE